VPPAPEALAVTPATRVPLVPPDLRVPLDHAAPPDLAAAPVPRDAVERRVPLVHVVQPALLAPLVLAVLAVLPGPLALWAHKVPLANEVPRVPPVCAAAPAPPELKERQAPVVQPVR